jgi:hypothetical protein
MIDRIDIALAGSLPVDLLAAKRETQDHHDDGRRGTSQDEAGFDDGHHGDRLHRDLTHKAKGSSGGCPADGSRARFRPR